MRLSLLDVLGCPRCHGELACVCESQDAAGDIQTGTFRRIEEIRRIPAGGLNLFGRKIAR